MDVSKLHVSHLFCIPLLQRALIKIIKNQFEEHFGAGNN